MVFTEPLTLIPPYGGQLVNLVVDPEARDDLSSYAHQLPSLQLSERSVCDLELLAVGGFSPLDRFLDNKNYQSIIDSMRLSDGHIFPIPITLPVEDTAKLQLDKDFALRNPGNELLAIMTIEEIFDWDRHEMSQCVFGTTDQRHPLIAEMQNWGKRNISGRLQVLQLPVHYDYPNLRLTPADTRVKLQALGRPNVVAFQTRNPMHRAHEELTKRAIEELNATLLLHPVVGVTKPGDIDHHTRVRTYKALLQRYYDAERVLLALLPLAMRMAGPREALWHALIRRNYGANYLIVGRDHASPGKDSRGRPFYPPYEAQQLVEKVGEELGVRIVPFRQLVFIPEEQRYEEISVVRRAEGRPVLSGTEIREQYLDVGRPVPDSLMRAEVAKILAESHPPRFRKGVCLWFTGLVGAGKSTTAEVLSVLLTAAGRQVTLLDGDVVRTHLSKGLGFTREDRDTNVRRVGFVASEIVRHHGVAVCALVSPYRAARNNVRNMVGAESFIEIFVDTPLELCEQRDLKGIYTKAQRGELRGVTGVDDPYEVPLCAEIVLDTVLCSAEENANRILTYLINRGFAESEVAAEDQS